MTQGFSDFWKRAEGVSKTSTQDQEMQRILGLPVVGPITPEELEAFNENELRPEAFKEGFRLFPVQAEGVLAYDQCNGLFGPIGVGQGKCAGADTEFYDLEKGRRRVDEPAGEATVATMASGGKITRGIASLFPSGHKECSRVRLCSGEEVSLSLDHPVFTQRGWVKVEDLTPEDFVARPRSLPEPLKLAAATDAEVLFMGYMMADGGYSAGQPAFTNMEEEIWQELDTVVSTLGGSLGACREQKSRAITRYVRGLNGWLREIGAKGDKSTNKRLPASWYCLPKRQIRLFLSRFIACDGHLNISEGKVEIGLANRGLIADIQHLMLRLGTVSRIRYKESFYEKEGKVFDAWVLSVSGQPAVDFLIDLGYIPSKEVARVAIIANLRKFNTNVDLVPFGRKELSEACGEMGIPSRGGCWKKRKEYTGVQRTELRKFLAATTGQNVSRSKFRAFVEKYGYSGKYAWLAYSELDWEKVSSITPEGLQPVYDLSVPGTESWVGGGVVLHNSLTTLMIASRAYWRGVERIVLFNPPQLIQQLRARALPWAREKVPIHNGFVWMDGKDPRRRAAIAKRADPGCYVMPYSLLSRPDTEDFLAELAPDLLIFDEAHYIKVRRSARTRRVLKYISAAKPQTVFLSGTMAQKSLVDFHHMITEALGNKSPLPVQANLMESWACSLDAGAEAPAENSTHNRGLAIRPLISWAKKQGLDVPANIVGARRAFRLRLQTAPGVVATPDEELGVSIQVHNIPVPHFDDPKKHPEWTELDRLMKQVDKEMVSPSGDEIAQAFHKWRFLDELTAGFYNLLEWPSAEKIAERRNITEAEAAEILLAAQDHHWALQEYNKLLRKFLSRHHVKGIDTPMLVGRHLSLHGAKDIPGGMGAQLFETWKCAKDLEFPGMPEREGHPVRVSPYKVNHAVEWAKKLSKGGILWYYHKAMGVWITEALKEAGIDAIHAPAGKAANALLSDPKNYKGRVVVPSMKAHCEGKDGLQTVFQDQMFVQMSRSASVMQQAIGRLHREGQQADELIVTKCDTTEFDSMNFAATLVDSAFQHGAGGNRQKLIYADYDPTPTLYPPEFLLEKGLDVQLLDEAERRLLTDKFGGAA